MNRRLTLPTALLLASCAHQPGGASRPTAQFVEWDPPNLPGICVPPPAGRLNKEQAGAWTTALAHMRAGELEQAQTAMAVVDGGQGAGSLIASARLAGPGSPPMKALYQAAQSPDAAPCVRHSGLLFATLIGNEDAAAAITPVDPTSLPNTGQVAALTGLRALNADGPTEALLPGVSAGIDAHPDYLPLRLLRGMVHHLLDRHEAAATDLRYVADLDPKYAEAFRLSLRKSNNLAGYLRHASEQGMPLGDGGSLATAPDPVAAFRDLLGVGPTGSLTATIETSEGPVVCDLFWEHAPVTVGSFVGLATGRQAWKDPRTGQPGEGALYDGTTFHRVIPEFMIQGGDPTGTGTGGPGYRFIDETLPVKSLDRPGLLAMANSGPATNGSQWFITETPVTYLDGKHTVFGECTPESLDIVKRIARVPRDQADRPQEPVVIERISVRGE